MAIKHAFTSGIADGGDATLVQPSNWNADHTIEEIQLVENKPILLDAALSADGTYSGTCEAGTTGETLVFGNLVYLKAADSKWWKTDSNALATANAKLGICVLAANADAATTILLFGKVNAASLYPPLTVGAKVYVGETAGNIQVAAPAAVGDVIRVIGYANTADELFFAPMPDSVAIFDDTPGGTDGAIYKAPTSNAFYDFVVTADFYLNKLNRLIEAHAGDATRVVVNANIPLLIGSHWFLTVATDVDAVDDLDTGTLAAGTNYYVYACTDGTTLSFKVSAASTYPSGFDAAHSRKIGGFHTLCVAVNHGGAGHTLSHWVADTVMAVGQSVIAVTPESPCFIYRVTAIAGDFKTHAATEPNWASISVGQTIVDDQVTWIKEQHTLEGYAVKDILPASIWDLKHRPRSNPEGMVFVTAIQKWVDIYLTSGTGASAASAYGATISDTRDWNDFCDDYAAVGKRMLHDHEFQAAAAGSNEETNITASGDPVTTGGHVDTAARRMISNWGIEDCCGALWQWLLDQSAYVDAAIAVGWYDLPGSKGQLYRPEDTGDVKLIAGGNWNSGVDCGSRSRYANSYRWTTSTDIGGRALSDPL
jgi:hypothetical protein